MEGSWMIALERIQSRWIEMVMIGKLAFALLKV